MTFSGIIEAETQILLNKGKSNIKNARDLKHFKNIVASSLVFGFNAYNKNTRHLEYFKEAREFLNKKMISNYQYYYVGIPSIVTCLLIVLLISMLFYKPIWLQEIHMSFLVASICGCCGACLSILQRFKSIGKDLSEYEDKYSVMAESFVRLSLGMAFGAIFVICQQAGLVLEVSKGNIYLTSLGGIVAGVNERFIPKLLSTAQKSFMQKTKE